MFWRSCNKVESLFRPAGLCCLRVTAFILGFPFLRDICLVLLPASLTTSALSILALNISHFPLERWFITAFRTTLSHSVALYFLFVRILLHFRGGCKSFWTFFFFFYLFTLCFTTYFSFSPLNICVSSFSRLICMFFCCEFCHWMCLLASSFHTFCGTSAKL